MLKINEYFDGRVKSIGFQDHKGSISSGVMEAGEYTFSTNTQERMTVLTGGLMVRRPTDADWITFRPGESFDVPGKVSFQVRVDETTAYLCRYQEC
ncbi:MAG TPA: pyrimidine/purine nucleoside phosphorylase [Candidatus Acetothermia bacterium]|nr:pyrimidine/purine nucleoside phosphorylase [Candidatus Acetothermia bacterium]